MYVLTIKMIMESSLMNNVLQNNAHHLIKKIAWLKMEKSFQLKMDVVKNASIQKNALNAVHLKPESMSIW